MEAGLRAARSTGAPVLFEITEFPDVVRFAGPAGILADLILLKRHLRRFDGVLVISRPIRDYVRQRVQVPTQLLGAVVDIAIAASVPLELGDTLSVGYAGSLSQEKDGILDLICAVAGASSRLAPGTSLRLEVFGECNSPDGLAAVREAQRLGVADRVAFHGPIPHADVGARLSECHVLALPRPVSRQASGGFPTKLGEYLSTARPVLTTAIGDVPRYLRHGETCLMVAPNDIGAIEDALVEIARNYSRCQAIGERGRELAGRSFAAERGASLLVSFIQTLGGRT